MTSVSIGLPVYNGERFLARALETILAQDHDDFELIICDNASTDRTPEIGQDLAASDARVQFHGSETNLGAAPNFNRAFDLATRPLFKWAAHDDLLEPGFLSACVRALDDAPDAVLAYPLAVEIDDDEQELRPYRTPFSDTASPDVHLRFRKLIQDEHNCFPVFGVIRREILAKTDRIGSYVGSDRVLLAHLGLFGPFVEVPQVLFRHREHKQRSTRAIPLHERTGWFDVRRAHKRVMPYWRFAGEYTRATLRAPLTPRQRLDCQIELLRWVKRYRRRLVHDVRVRLAPPSPRMPA
jgi:glycosyltransferase involved in cell wall biosynthesis